MLRRLFLSLTLALLFGLGQQGAAVHAISHLADWQDQQQDKHGQHKQACDKCIAYAELAGTIGSHHHLPAPAAFRHVLASLPAYGSSSPAPTAYSARAPPLYS